MSPRPFAAFDIDGTLIRWQLYHALADELAHRGLLDDQQYQQVKNARLLWKNRRHENAFQNYEAALVKLIDASLSGIAVEAFNQACERVIEQYKDQVYTYTRDLIQQLKAQDYLLFALSASQVEIVKLIADYYGFDDCGGSRYEIKDGRFTGKKHLLIGQQKPELLRQLAAKHQAGQRGSLAVGDSDGDVLMLEAVEQPIAFNPTKQLFEHARSRHWPIVLERKTVVYELQPREEGYTLA